MNKIYYFLIFILILVLLCFGRNGIRRTLQNVKTDNTLLSTEEMKADLDYLKSCVLQNHPKMLNEETKKEYLNFYETLYSKVRTPMSKNNFYFLTMKALARLKDGHTSVDLYSPTYKSIDLNFVWLDEGLIISEGNGILKKGDRILAIGNMKPQKILDNMREVISSENDNWVKFKSEQFLPTQEFLSYLNLINKDGKVEVKVERTYGKNDVIRMNFDKEINIMKEFYDFEPYYFEVNENSDLGIFYLNACVYNTDYEEKVEEFFKIVNEKDINKIVVDLRQNSGGDSRTVYTFIKHLDKIKKVYVLISKETFSSAILFAGIVKNNDLGIIVGESTGGGTVGYGNIIDFELPNSGINFNVATKLVEILNKSGFSETLEPDNQIQIKRQDIIEDKDPIMDWILSQ